MIDNFLSEHDNQTKSFTTYVKIPWNITEFLFF